MDRPIDDILRDAEAIAARPCREQAIPNFPCVVRRSLAETEGQAGVSLVLHEGFPVFVFPKGARPTA